MRAKFLGRSKQKFSCNPSWDYCILIEELKEWPSKLVVRVKNMPEHIWCMPFDGVNWAIYSVPHSLTSLSAYFGGIADPHVYQNLYDESENCFEITVNYSDGTSELCDTTDGRRKLNFTEEVEYLKSQEEWVVAVPTEFVADDTSESDKEERALSILEQFADFKLGKMKCLDFGCGEGHVSKQLVKNGVGLSVGYDIKTTPELDDKLIITTDFNQVIDNGPYDFVLLYDVLDHVENETPIDILHKLKSVIKSNTIIKIRCHPWIARHGGHQYKTFNKAFAHLILTEEELPQLIHCIKINNPLRTYREWFNSTGFSIKTETTHKEPIESFFKLGLIKKRIMHNQDMRYDELENLQYSFIDYELSLL